MTSHLYIFNLDQKLKPKNSMSMRDLMFLIILFIMGSGLSERYGPYHMTHIE